MPALAISLLILVYVVAAIAEGKFLAHLAGNFAIGAWLWYSVSAVIQATRALLVYFPLLNPNRPTFGYQGEVIAIIMGLIAIGSIWGAVDAVGLPHPVAISLSILMAAGIGVEVYLLREIKFSTEQEMFANREYWEELAQFARAKRELQLFLDGIKDYEPDASQLIAARSVSPTPAAQPPAAPDQPSARQPEERQRYPRMFSERIMNAIGAADNLTEQQMQRIRQWIDEGLSDSDIVGFIHGMSEKNQQRRAERAAHNVPLDFSAADAEDHPHPLQELFRNSNGNGTH